MPADGFVDVEEDDSEAAREAWSRVFPGGIPATLSFRSSGTGGMHRIYGLSRNSAGRLVADLIEWSAAARRAREGRAIREQHEARRNEPIPSSELEGLPPLQQFQLALRRRGHPSEQTRPSSYSCCCTAADHHDRNPSMTFGVGRDGCLLVTCHSRGCTLTEILEGIGLRAADAFPRGRIIHVPDPRRPGIIDLIQDEEAEAWAEEQDRYARALDERPDLRQLLADRLGLPLAALDVLSFVYCQVNRSKAGDGRWVDRGGAWTWPEHDHRFRVVGIHRRFVDPERAGSSKRLIGGRHDRATGQVLHAAARGLAIPDGFKDRPGPVLVVEGESDVLALHHAGRDAVGRPGSRAGVGEVARLLKDDPRECIVLGERDKHASGAWPGDPGPPARTLGRLLGRPVLTLLPPDPYKDAREWIASRLAKS